MSHKHWVTTLKDQLDEQRQLIAKLYDQRDALKERALDAEMACEAMKRIVERKEEERKDVLEARKFRVAYAQVCERLESLNEENRVLYRRIDRLEFKDG